MRRKLDSTYLEKYLRSASSKGNLSFMPNDSSDLKVSNLEKLHPRSMSEVYSFSLTFAKGGFKQCLGLVLKGYLKPFIWRHYAESQIRDDSGCVGEFLTLKNLGRICFPVPQVYHCETDISFLGYPFTIMEKLDAPTVTPKSLELYASILAHLHSLEVDKLEITSLKLPENGFKFATNWTVRFRRAFDRNRRFRWVSKTLGLAEHWVDCHAANAYCPRYSLLHGDYHFDNVLLTEHSGPKVIDWEAVEIGDPAYDVAYAYHMFKVLGVAKTRRLCGHIAEQFVSEYLKHDKQGVSQRLEFYKAVALLGLAIKILSWSSNPLKAYECYGLRAFYELPISRFPYWVRQYSKKYSGLDFACSLMQYFEDYFEDFLRSS